MTYNVSSGTLNSTIQYHLVWSGPSLLYDEQHDDSHYFLSLSQSSVASSVSAHLSRKHRTAGIDDMCSEIIADS